MKYRKLGDTDIDVSVICLGTMTWGEQNTELEGHQQMDYAFEKGVNFWDTAELYPVPAKAHTTGETERVIGTWFRKNGRRSDVILASKIAGPGPYTAHIRDVNDYSPESIKEALEGSLRRLQTDYIDLYQIHWPARSTNFFGNRSYFHEEGWEENFQMILQTLQELIREGKIRYIGISNETPWGFSKYLQLAEKHNLPKVVSVQNPYNLLNRTYEVGMSEISIRENAGLLAYSPMAFGMLSGKYHEKKDTPNCRINKYKGYDRYSSENCLKATEMYLNIAKENGMTLAEMSLAWVNQQQFVTSNIIGATSMKQLKENIGSIDYVLSKDVVKAINSVQALYPNPAP